MGSRPIDTGADRSFGCGYLELATIASGWASSFGFLVAMHGLRTHQAALSPARHSLPPIGSPPQKPFAAASSIFIGVGLSFNRRNRGPVLRLARSLGAWLG